MPERSLQDPLFILIILDKEEPYTVPLGMDFQLNLPKPVKKFKKIKNEKSIVANY